MKKLLLVILLMIPSYSYAQEWDVIDTPLYVTGEDKSMGNLEKRVAKLEAFIAVYKRQGEPYYAPAYEETVCVQNSVVGAKPYCWPAEGIK